MARCYLKNNNFAARRVSAREWIAGDSRGNPNCAVQTRTQFFLPLCCTAIFACPVISLDSRNGSRVHKGHDLPWHYRGRTQVDGFREEDSVARFREELARVRACSRVFARPNVTRDDTVGPSDGSLNRSLVSRLQFSCERLTREKAERERKYSP